MPNVIPNSRRTRVLNSTAAGTTTFTSAIISTADFATTVFEFLVGTATAGQQTVFKVQGGNLANGSDMADLAGTHVGPLPDSISNGVVAIEIYQNIYAYLQAVVVRSTQNVALDGIIASQHGAKRPPATDSTLTSHLVISPAQSTA
jgi:hypothetical protein